MTDSEFAACVKSMTALVQKPMPHDQIEAYFRMLSDLPYRSVAAGIAAIMATSEFPTIPTVGAIRKAAMAHRDGLTATPEEAWDRVKTAIRHHGTWNPQRAEEMCGSMIWNAIRGIGGWSAVCDAENPQIMFAQFREAWSRITSQGEKLRQIPEKFRPEVVGIPDISDTVADVAKQLAKLAEPEVAPLRLGPVERPAAKPDSKILEAVATRKPGEPPVMLNGFPVNPIPGDDCTRGYHIVSPTGSRFVSPDDMAAELMARSTAIAVLGGDT